MGGGHMLGADQRGPAFTSCFLGRQMMGNAEQRLDPGERRVRMPSTSEWVFFFWGGCFFLSFFFFVPSEVVFAHERVCLHARTHARVYLSSRFPQCTIGPGGRERETKSE